MIAMRVLGALFLLWGLSGCLVEEDGQPVANAGPDKVIFVSSGSIVPLSAEASFDPNGDSLVYHWSIESMPDGSNAILDSFVGLKVKLTVDRIGTYEIGLIVDDGISPSNKDIVKIEYRSESRTEISPGDTVPSVLMPPETSGPPQPFHEGIDDNQCSDCHTRPVFHFKSTNNCDACHNRYFWTPAVTVDHSQVVGTCVGCHNGSIAMGIAPNHIRTTSWCDACHSTNLWVPVIKVDHSQVVGACNSCHNGTVATGKPSQHIASANNCEGCHSTISWLSQTGAVGGSSSGLKVIFDHTGIIDGCAQCHDGNPFMGKPPFHFATTDSCGACHATSAFIPVITVDHVEVLGECVTCHDNFSAKGKSATHILTTDYCASCHVTSSFIPVVTVDHNEIWTVCGSCHNGNVAFGKHSAHIVSTDNCGACHSTSTFTPSAVDHNEVLEDCVDCHASPLNHVAQGITAICSDCHSVFSWKNAAAPLPSPPAVNNGG